MVPKYWVNFLTTSPNTSENLEDIIFRFSGCMTEFENTSDIG